MSSVNEMIPNLLRRRTRKSPWIDKFLTHGPWCHYCEIRLTLDTAVKEHLIPLCRGGVDVIDNLVPACADCNRMKAWRTETEFIRDRPMLLSKQEVGRKRALPTPSGISLELFNEPGLLKKLVHEREFKSHWWKA